MRPDDLRRLLQQRPFRPFRLWVLETTAYEIRHPELVLLGRSTITLDLPVPDSAAKQLMISLHRRLTAGCSPAAALAGAQETLRRRRSGFICIGTG